MYRTLVSASLTWCLFAPAAEINHDDHTVAVTFANGVELNFAIDQGNFLGLATASVNGIATTAPDTVFRPYFAEDMFGQPVFTHALTLKTIEKSDDGVTLTLETRATSDTQALKKFYNMAPDKEAVTENDQLKALRLAAEIAQRELDAYVIANEKRVQKHQQLIADIRALPATTDPQEQQIRHVRLGNHQRDLAKQINRALNKKFAEDKHVHQLQATIAAYQKALFDTAVEQGVFRIHDDYFGQAIPHLPAETAHLDNQKVLAAMPGEITGTLTWTFTPESVNIAGWDWQGWSHHIAYEGLNDSPQFRVLRNQGTWELGGEAVGSTVVAMRYRGLGSIEETFADDGSGGIDRCFTTTEILPGVANGEPVISPAVPQSITVGDRGYGMKHRLAAWIGMMARGGGANVVDFQYRPEAIYASFPVRQGNLRACTEAFPGDHHISQRDEEWFAQGRSFSSTPFMHLVLTPPQKEPNSTFSRWQSITRWQEVDQHVRDIMADELNMIQPEPLPAAGYNTDYAWEKRVGDLAKQIDATLGPQGVRMILQHQPGWVNGRDLRQKKDPRYAGGGDCTPYDFTAEGGIAEAWQKVSVACAKWDIDYYAWLSTIAYQSGQFALEVDAELGGFQGSWGEIGNGAWTRSRQIYAFDPKNPTFMQKFQERMDAARNELGFQGIWADSWQKWTTSFSASAEGRPPLARKFWEMYAKWSHQGVALMSESQAFPGLSCSIELPNNNYDDEWWFMRHTVKWFRATTKPPGAGTPAATDFTFRMYANKATVTWNTEHMKDLSDVVPEWSRLAHEYLAALPMMRRSWVLPNGSGVLWLGYDDDQHGVWYPFTDTALPAGVTAAGVINSDPVTTARKLHVLAVSADDLLKAFNLQRGPLNDPRIGRTYVPFIGSTPDFIAQQ